MNCNSYVIARILNHKQTDVTSAVYNQYQYLKEKREALDAWGSRVSKITSDLRLIERNGAPEPSSS